MRAFKAAYGTLGLEGNIVAVDTDPLAPALWRADRPYIVPKIASPDYLPALLRIIEREQVNAIFPLIDPEIPVLARHREAIEAAGARLAVVSSQAAVLCSDKWLQTAFFRQLNLPVPQTWLPGTIDAAEARYPLFIKPRNGSAGTNAFKVRSPAELEFFSCYVPNAIIQEFLPGPEITNDVVCDLDGDVLAVVSRRRIEVRWGEVAKGVTHYDPSVAKVCRTIAAALPAVGPITVQCIMKEGAPFFTEINARLGGGLPLGVAAGVDSPRLILSRLAGIPMPSLEDSAYRTGFFMTRYDESSFITQAEYEQMASRCL